MKCNKTILMSTVCLFAQFYTDAYASYPLSLSAPNSGIRTYHTQHTVIDTPTPLPSHLSKPLKASYPSREEPKRKLASVCFITDTTDCSYKKFDIPEYNICVEDGYDKTLVPTSFTFTKTSVLTTKNISPSAATLVKGSSNATILITGSDNPAEDYTIVANATPARDMFLKTTSRVDITKPSKPATHATA